MAVGRPGAPPRPLGNHTIGIIAGHPPDRPDDVNRLLNGLCHLMVAFEHVIGDTRDGAGDAVALDMPELAVLVSLDLFGEMRPTTIAELLGGTRSMTTKLVGRLERDGYLVRHLGPIPEDRRAVTVEITDRGHRAIDACDRVLAGLSVDVLTAMAAVEFRATAAQQEASRTGDLPGQRAPSTGAGLAEFFRFVVEIDKPIVATVGALDLLHPADPRGLLVLSELDLRGPLRIGAVPALIDRSRNTAHRRCTQLEEAGFVARRPGTISGDQRGVVIVLTDLGRTILRGVVAAITAHLPELRPSMVSLSLALSGERQGLGAPAG